MASSLPMTGRSFRPHPHLTEKQRLTGKIANKVRPCDEINAIERRAHTEAV
jgi:hypothetical protein